MTGVVLSTSHCELEPYPVGDWEAGADCGLLGGWYDCVRAGARLKCLWKSRPGAWRLCSIAIFLRVACFLCSVFLEPSYEP